MKLLKFGCILFRILCYFHRVNSRKTGAPCSALENMTPQHPYANEHVNIQFRMSLKDGANDSPTSCYNHNMTVKVMFSTTSSVDIDQYFDGFIIQAREEDETRRTGIFNTDRKSRIQCDERGAVTHTNSEKAKHIDNFYVTWKPDRLFKEKVYFYSVIATSMSQWFRNDARKLKYMETCGNTAVGDSANVYEDEFVEIPVLLNDHNGKELSILAITRPYHGNATILGKRTIKYFPNRNFNGVDWLEYDVKNKAGDTETALVEIKVNRVNDPPEAIEDNAIVINGQSVDINVIENDRDIDSDTSALEVRSIAVQPTKGNAVVLNKSSVTYSAKGGFTGVTDFKYFVNDDQGSTSIGLVKVTVKSMLANGCIGNGNYSNAAEGDDETKTKPYVHIEKLSYVGLNDKEHCICAGCKLVIQEKSKFSSHNVTIKLEKTKSAFEVTNSIVSLKSSTLLLYGVKHSKICILTHAGETKTNQSQLSVSNSFIKLKNSRITTCKGHGVSYINITGSSIDFRATDLKVHPQYVGSARTYYSFQIKNSVIFVDDTLNTRNPPSSPKASFLIRENSTFRSTGASIRLNMPSIHNIWLSYSDMILDDGANITGLKASEIRIDLAGIRSLSRNENSARCLFHLKSRSLLLWHYGPNVQILLRGNSSLIIESGKSITLSGSPKMHSQLLLVKSILVIETDFKMRNLVLKVEILNCTMFRSYKSEGTKLSVDKKPTRQDVVLKLKFQKFVNNRRTNEVKCNKPEEEEEVPIDYYSY